MMFWDYSISTEAWCALTPEQQKERRIHIRAYFLWMNGMPGSDLDRLITARFEDQFDREFYQMECRRSADGIGAREKLFLLVAEPLVGILRMHPKDIAPWTGLPSKADLLMYLSRRVNSMSMQHFNEQDFFTAGTVGRLVDLLLAQNARRLVLAG